MEVLSILSEHKHAADAPFILSFFGFFTILLSPLTQTQYTLCFPSLSYPSNLFLFTLHLPPVSQHSHRVLCFPLCCGSRSSISLSELSGACCPETANIRDVVINGTSIFPPPPPPRAHQLVRSPPSLQTTLPVQLYICQKPNGPRCCDQSS